MSGFSRRLYNTVYALICVAPAFIWIGYMLTGDYIRSSILLGATAAAAYALTFVPGRVRGIPDLPHSEPIKRHTGDIDPDRGLRSDSHEAIKVRQGFPLRSAAVMLAAAAMFIALFFIPTSSARAAGLFERFILSGLAAATLPLTLGALSSGAEGRGMGIGAGLYAVSGITQLFVNRPELNAVMPPLVIAYLVMTAAALNDISLYKGAVARSGVKPPQSVRNRNRLLMLLPCAAVAFIALFDQIRAWAVNALRYAVIAAGRAMLWLGGLLNSPARNVPGNSPDFDILAELGGEAAEPSAFWQAAEKIFMVIAIVIFAIVVLYLARQATRFTAALLKRAIARFIRFGHSLGESYHDERESLIDWGEVKRAAAERAGRQWARLRRREKRWPQMDGRERARYIVRRLYMKSGADALYTLTIREAAPFLRLGAAQPGNIATIYERARYSPYEVDVSEVDALKRQVG